VTLGLLASVCAISLLASILLIMIKPSPALATALEIVSADSASPSALMTFACLSCSLGVLLRDLLLLDGSCEFLAECHVRDRDVLKSDVELLSTLEKVGADAVADCFSLSDQLSGVELGNDRF